MSDTPLVSVNVPSYNRAHVLAQTLDSILAQTYPNLEILVVDDGSKDNTEEIATAPRYRDRVTYIRQPNAGLAAARNTALNRSTGKYVAWLDSDDLWNPEKIALQVAWMEAHPDNVLVASDFSAFDDDGFFELSHVRAYYAVIDRTPGGLAGYFPDQEDFTAGGTSVHVYSGEIYDQMIGGNCLHPPTTLFRRDAALRAGLLDKAFRRDSDYEYFLRLSREGRIAYIDRPLMRYRYSPGQMSSDQFIADILLSRVIVLESVVKRDPALRDRESFRHRLGFAHVSLAHALADGPRRPAARHLLASLRLAYADALTARTVAKLCLPRWLVERYRRTADARRA